MQKLKTLPERGFIYVSDSSLCKGKGLFAGKNFKKGEVIYVFKGEYVKADLTNVSCPYALQLDFSLYLIPEGEGKYLNHSCEPNCKLSLQNGQLMLIAIKEIKKDEELCYNYNTSEYDMGVDAFKCSCKSINCIGYIRGFKYLSYQEKIKIKDLLLPYLNKLI